MGYFTSGAVQVLLYHVYLCNSNIINCGTACSGPYNQYCYPDFGCLICSQILFDDIPVNQCLDDTHGITISEPLNLQPQLNAVTHVEILDGRGCTFCATTIQIGFDNMCSRRRRDTKVRAVCSGEGCIHVLEGGTLDVKVTKIGPNAANVTLYSTDVTANSSSSTDYQSVNTVLEFVEYDNTIVSTIKSTNNNIIDGDRSFLLTLSNATVGFIQEPSIKCVIIVDDEGRCGSCGRRPCLPNQPER
ncbi:uncharacterized protein [Amphiura filiformis]|uniref:uncharacterized protein n=1 Tax=Amphiura filiformis TaxID=82378 RepID=UPI003B212B1C